MLLRKLVNDLDKLTPDEKVQAIQYLASGLLQKTTQDSLSFSSSDSSSQADTPTGISSIESPTEQPVLSSKAHLPSNSGKKNGPQINHYSTEKITEISPDGKAVTVRIPGWQMVHDFAQEVCEAMAEDQQDPSIFQAEIVNGFANFIRVIAQIQANIIIREKIGGNEHKEEPLVEVQKTKRERPIRSNRIKDIVRVDDHWHIEYDDE